MEPAQDESREHEQLLRSAYLQLGHAMELLRSTSMLNVDASSNNAALGGARESVAQAELELARCGLESEISLPRIRTLLRSSCEPLGDGITPALYSATMQPKLVQARLELAELMRTRGIEVPDDVATQVEALGDQLRLRTPLFYVAVAVIAALVALVVVKLSRDDSDSDVRRAPLGLEAPATPAAGSSSSRGDE